MAAETKFKCDVCKQLFQNLDNNLKEIVKNNYNAFAALTTLACGDENGDGYWESKKARDCYIVAAANCYNNFARINNYCSTLEALAITAKTVAMENKNMQQLDYFDDQVDNLGRIAKNCSNYCKEVLDWASKDTPRVVKPI